MTNEIFNLRVWKFLLTRRVQRRASAGDKNQELKQASKSFLQIAGHIPASVPHGHPSGSIGKLQKGVNGRPKRNSYLIYPTDVPNRLTFSRFSLK